MDAEGEATLGIASGALVPAGLLLRVNINANIFYRSGFTCKCQLSEEKTLSLPFQVRNLSSLKGAGASFFSDKLLVQQPRPMARLPLLHLGEQNCASA